MTAVLILTGLADSRWTWRPVAAALPGHHVVIADRLQHRVFPTLAAEVARIGHDLARVEPVHGNAGPRDATAPEAAGEATDRPILVAHSVAAFAAEAYARQHRLAGLVLVDPSCEPRGCPRGAIRSGAARAAFAASRRLAKLLDDTGTAGVLGPAMWRLAVRRRARTAPSPPVAAAARAEYRHGDVICAALAEELAYPEFAADLWRLRRRTAAPTIPVRVLTALAAEPPSAADRRWSLRHRLLAESFPAGRHMDVHRCGHLMQLDRPDAIVAAVTAMADHG
jgi:hypothetical protein